MKLRRRATVTALTILGLVSCFGGDDDPPGATPNNTPVIPSGNPDGKDDGGECAVGNDCKSGVCKDTKCAAPTASDGVRNGEETGLDCGGPTAPKCTGGAPCKVASDCASNECKDNLCGGPKEEQPRIDDGKKNGDETDIDCGGPAAPKCADNKGCKAAADCTSGVCTNSICQVPKPNDGVKNGDESDVDCGGTTTGAPACAVGKLCNAHADCVSDGCDYNKKCALSRSCTAHFGGDTCGSGEVGQAGAQHESCCRALAIPGGGMLDKYQVTAGRMRAMVDRLNGDVLGWYEANKAKLPAATQAQIEPYKASLPSGKTNNQLGTEYQLGGTIYLPMRPSTSQGCAAGKAGDNGSHTYWNGAAEGEDRGLTKDDLDTRSLNCVPYPLMAAFCAWDGGRLQTNAEHNAAWGAAKYPWGAAPLPAGYALVGGNWTKVSGDYQGPTYDQPCPTCADDYANWRNNYQFPAGGNAAKPWDYAYWISAPGRFPKGISTSGHADLAGNLMELVADTNGVDNSAGGGNQTRVRWTKNGSWEGHQITYSEFSFSYMTKYGKTGGRCAR